MAPLRVTEPLVEVSPTEISIAFWLEAPVTPLIEILLVAKIVLLAETVTPTTAVPREAKLFVVALMNPVTGVQFVPEQPYELSRST